MNNWQFATLVALQAILVIYVVFAVQTGRLKGEIGFQGPMGMTGERGLPGEPCCCGCNDETV